MKPFVYTLEYKPQDAYIDVYKQSIINSKFFFNHQKKYFGGNKQYFPLM